MPLSILLVSNGLFPEQVGGAERYATDLAARLAQRGHRVTVLAPAFSRGLPGREARSGLDVCRYPYRGPLRHLAALAVPALLLRAAGGPRAFEVINVHFAWQAFGLLHLFRRLPPILLHFHGPWGAEMRSAGHPVAARACRAIEGRVVARAGRLVTLSQAMAQVLADTHEVLAGRVSVVPGGVDCERFSPGDGRRAARRRLGLPEDAVVLVAARRLVPRNGLDLLLRALPAATEAVPAVRLLLAGQGPEEARLRSLAAGLGIGERARFAGCMPDAELPELYRAADLVVLPSRALEGFGLAAAEALACGTPVACTPVGGLREVVGGLCPDLVAADATPDALAGVLIGALMGEVPLPSGEACRAYAVGRYAWEQVAPRVEGEMMRLVGPSG